MEKLSRLYEQGATRERIGSYIKQWGLFAYGEPKRQPEWILRVAGVTIPVGGWYRGVALAGVSG